MYISNSPDINNLLVKAIWDISGKYPILYLENQSTGVNLANISYAFVIKSPSETVIWDGSLTQPDISGIWTNFTFYSYTPDPLLSPPPTNYIVAGWPRPFNQIEWSGAPYYLSILAKDSLGNVFQLDMTQLICRPAGNIPTSTTTYGLGNVNLTINCNSANGFFEDVTNTSYKGLAGTLESSQLKVYYPDDETDAAPTPFIINNFSTALAPITYDSNNYEFVYSSIYLYDFTNNSFVRVKYYEKQRFSVNCNIDLCPLVCEYEKLLQQAENGACGGVAETTQKLLQINGKMNLALIAKSQPLCGIDLPALIDEIKAIGGFECDCCTPSGIQPFNSANLGDYNFQVISGGGDINGTVTVTGNNIQFTLYDKNYIFKICDTAPTTAFTVTPTTAGYTKTYCLNVDMTILATDILNVVKNNVTLVNLFNSIVDFGSTNTKLIVDGGCIFTSSSSCDYTYELANIPASVTYALITSIKVGAYVIPIYFAFNQTNLPALETYLNSLNFGVFVVTDLGFGNITIVSVNNGFGLGDITYKIVSTTYIADFSKTCTGYIPIDASEVVQNIIDYLCALTDAQVKTSQIYTICYIDPADSLKKTKAVASGSELNVMLAELLDRNCDTVDFIISEVKTFQNGLTETSNVVELGGTLIKSTTIDVGTFVFTVRSGSLSELAVSKNYIANKVQAGSAGTDPVTVLFQPASQIGLVSTTVAERNAIAYYSTQVVSGQGDGKAAFIGTHVPTTNDTSLASPPPIDPDVTAKITASQNGVGGTGLVEIYGKEHTFTGEHSTFYSYIVPKKLSAADIAAIGVSLLVEGMIVYDTTNQKLNFWDGSAWRVVTST